MKKFISIVLSLAVIFSSVFTFANALSIDSGKTALREQFVYGKGPKVGLYSVDYRYYSPVKENDTAKYPVVIWAHGHSHGQYDGYQILSNDIVNWASDEFQSRFGDVGGAYIVAVRAPENIGISWGDDMVQPLKAAIDDFIVKNKENVDASKIYLGGFSLGGMMSFKMAINYPQMFAAIFPVCPYITISDNDAKKISHIPVWLTSGKSDPLVNYNTQTSENWKAIKNTTLVPESCRFSTLSKVCKPDGLPAPSAHYSWEAVTNDMFSYSDGAYPYMSTEDAAGNTVELVFPFGMIHWLSSFSSEYTVNEAENQKITTPKVNILNIIKAPFMVVYIIFRNLVRPIFG